MAYTTPATRWRLIFCATSREKKKSGDKSYGKIEHTIIGVIKINIYEFRWVITEPLENKINRTLSTFQKHEGNLWIEF